MVEARSIPYDLGQEGYEEVEEVKEDLVPIEIEDDQNPDEDGEIFNP